MNNLSLLYINYINRYFNLKLSNFINKKKTKFVSTSKYYKNKQEKKNDVTNFCIFLCFYVFLKF